MKFKGLLLIFCVLCAAVYTAFYGFFQYINYSFPTVYEGITLSVTGQLQSGKAADNAAEEKQSQQESNSSATQKDSTASVTASSPGQAVGKITSKFISPYTANTKYGNVYLKNNAGADIDVKSLLEQKLSFKIEKSTQPQVLIVHTHTTESFMLEERDYYTADDASRSLDEEKNMIAVGNIIEQKLTAAGIGVIHDTAIHDYPSYSGSYTRSAETIQADLKAYPSIKIVIDIHRDAISGENSEKIKPVTQIDGENAAQVMLVMGSQTGSIEGYPNWKDNLSLAVKYQQTLEVMYPGLARAITLNSGKYNQHLTKGSILLEVGTDANTLEEAKKGASYAADALVSLLNTLK